MFKLRGQGKGLAVVAILMGMAASARAGDERMLYASLGDTARAPIGWIEFCADNASECRGGTSEPRDIVLSQTADHLPYGGVVPEIAARAHLDHIEAVIAKALQDAHAKLSDLDAIAVNGGPGLDRAWVDSTVDRVISVERLG